ncbi:MAG: chemotaxis protein MotB [Verrucomicrobia bacterium]|nr:chemotaxis protein MotB [Verrucomicrobiota bacterium]
MPKHTWTIAAFLSLFVLMGVGFLQYRSQQGSLDRAEAAVEESKKALAATRSEQTQLHTTLQTSLERIAELEAAMTEATQKRSGLEDQMRQEVQSRDVTISELRGRLTVDILDRVLFDSGESRLKPEGEAILARVAQVLSRFPGRALQVVGHTDNVPIRNRTPDGFTDNWALSAGRAVSAVRFLVDKAGVDPRWLTAVGCGEFHPIAPNDAPEGRARNRRIAIVVLPEELAATDLPKPKPAPEPAPDPVPPAAPEASAESKAVEEAPKLAP